MNNNLEKIIGYTFKNKKLLNQALTHSSSRPHPLNCNERMEFLGDSVLSVVVSKYLYDSLNEQSEGYLTKLRANLVCEEALYKYAKRIDLGGKLIMGKGEELTGGRDRKSILADAFEALIAAIYLDSGLTAATEFIVPFLPSNDVLKVGKLVIGDYKTTLQEIVQQIPENTISYELIGEEGFAHEKIFYANVVINGKVEGSGSGKSKKESQQQAARAALIKLGSESE
ncbi:MAG: ribonuclease III [Oscillospiraceae bacterium]|nr:ribonuclease III [Oscillospiraceae bacterium]